MKKKVSCGLQGTEWVESMWFDLYSAEERLQLTVADPLEVVQRGLGGGQGGVPW